MFPLDWERLFGTFYVGECTGPSYACRFLLDGREVYRVRYNDLVNTGGQTVRPAEAGPFAAKGWR
jgi:hypothetical protein